MFLFEMKKSVPFFKMSCFLLLFILGTFISGNSNSEKSGNLTSATTFMSACIRGARREPRTAEAKAVTITIGLTAPSNISGVILNNAFTIRLVKPRTKPTCQCLTLLLTRPPGDIASRIQFPEPSWRTEWRSSCWGHWDPQHSRHSPHQPHY